MWLTFCVLTLCAISTQGAVQLSPSYQEVFSVSEGSELQFNCSSPNGVRWSYPDSNQSPGKVEGSVVGNDNISTLTFTSVQKSNEGTFFCKDITDGNSISFMVKVFRVTKEDVTYEYKEDALLKCRVEENYSFTYSWRKGSEAVNAMKKVDSKQEFVEHANGSLEIRNPPRNLAGVYTCVAQYEEGGKKHTIETDVNYFAQPKVVPFDKSKNLVQDERLVVECKVLGYPKPSISWFKGGVMITDKDTRYKMLPAKTYDGAEIDNGKLEIDSVNFDDAGEFTCMATSSKWADFNATQVILVRVKDKLAALWPFLGIVAEVVVLCTVIFIYEKKRNKDAAFEEDANQDGVSQEKKAEGVRHRGSPNNPRA